MNYKEIAQKITDEGVKMIEKGGDERFGLAQLTIKAISPLIQAMITDELLTNKNEAVKFQAKLLKQIEVAAK